MTNECIKYVEKRLKDNNFKIVNIKLLQSYCNYIIENQKKNRTSKAALQKCFYEKVFSKFGFE